MSILLKVHLYVSSSISQIAFFKPEIDLKIIQQIIIIHKMVKFNILNTNGKCHKRWQNQKQNQKQRQKQNLRNKNRDLRRSFSFFKYNFNPMLL